jgi:hypothetical protein
MATYIKGVTDVLPGPTAMAPNYALLHSTLSTLQNKYDRGFDAVKSMYTSMINGELSSSDNEQFRQEFLKKADAQLSKFSGVDLSNPNNVSQATNVFKPLVNDKQYVKDLYLTKSQNAEIEKMESTKTSTDAKIRAEYDPKMEEWLYLGKKRLTEMKRDDGSIDKATYNKFFAWENPIEYAQKIAKDQGLSLETKTIEGLYFHHKINGKDAVGPFADWFEDVIGDKFDNQFRIEGELDYEHGVQALMKQDNTLTRESATQKMAQDFSTQYVKTYNEKLQSYKDKITNIDNGIRAAKRNNPNGVTADKAQEIKDLIKYKNEISDAVTKLTNEKGTDEEFQKKAVDLFINNPAGTYLDKVRRSYGLAFANVQSKTNVKDNYEPNSVAMQLQEQSFQMKKMREEKALSWAYKQKEMDLAYQYDLSKITTKLQLEGKLAGQTGASYGPTEDAGTYSVDYLFKKQGSDNYDKVVNGYTNDVVLSLAANIPYQDGAMIIEKGNLNMTVVKDALRLRANGKKLTVPQATELQQYLKMVDPSFKFTGAQSFNEISNVLNKAIRVNSKNNPKLGKLALPIIQDVGNAKNAYETQFLETQKHLAAIYANSPDMRQYITSTNGTYDINYEALAKVSDANEKGRLTASLIPKTYYDDLHSISSVKSNSIELHPADPKKFDATVIQNVIKYSTGQIGAVGTNGEFQQLSDDQVKKIQNALAGDANLKQLFDTGMKFQLEIKDNKKYWKVTVPVNVNAKGESEAKSFGINFGNIPITNKIQFLVPIENTEYIASNDMIMVNPITGEKSVVRNDLRSLLEEQSIYSANPAGSKSWVTNNGLDDPKDGVSGFPSYLLNRVSGGDISHDGNNNITINFQKDDGQRIHINYTNKKHVSYNDYMKHPEKYDSQLRTYVEDIVNSYYLNNVSASEDRRVRHSLRTDLVPWSQIE